MTVDFEYVFVQNDEDDEDLISYTNELEKKTMA